MLKKYILLDYVSLLKINSDDIDKYTSNKFLRAIAFDIYIISKSHKTLKDFKKFKLL